MSDIWEKLGREAERGAGGEWPEVEDDLYPAEVVAVSDPEDQEDRFHPGQMKTQFYVTWGLRPTDGQAPVADGTTLRQYISLPEQYLTAGWVSDKSWLWRTMEALGYDLSGRFRVHPPEWVGKRARVMVENKASQSTGDVRPRITDVKPLPRQRAQTQVGQGQQRVANQPGGGQRPGQGQQANRGQQGGVRRGDLDDGVPFE